MDYRRFDSKFIFHHKETPQSSPVQSENKESEKNRPERGDIPIDAQRPLTGPEGKVMDSRDLFEAPHYQADTYRPAFAENPDNMASWRFLSGPMKIEYQSLPPSRRDSYLKQHRAYIQASYQASKNFYEKNIAPSMKAPVLRPSLTDQPELLVQKKIFVLGGNISRGISEKIQGAETEYVAGNDPETILKNFEEHLKSKNLSSDQLKDLPVVYTPDPQLFGSQTPHEKYVQDTEKLLVRLKELGMKVTVISPLKTFNLGFSNVPRDRNVPVYNKDGFTPDNIMARQRRNDYWESMCEFKAKGLVTALVDLGDATQDRSTLGTNNKWLSDNPDEVLNELGMQMAVNSAVMGVNASMGYEAGNFQNAKYWPGGELYDLGTVSVTGRRIRPEVAGSPLIPESERNEARERVGQKHFLEPLRRLASSGLGQELVTMDHEKLYKTYIDKDTRYIQGANVEQNPARYVVHEAFRALESERKAGHDVTKEIREFAELSSLVFVKMARIAIIHAREIFDTKPDDPQYQLALANRKNAYESAERHIKKAKDSCAFYGSNSNYLSLVDKDWATFNEIPSVKAWKG